MRRPPRYACAVIVPVCVLLSVCTLFWLAFVACVFACGVALTPYPQGDDEVVAAALKEPGTKHGQIKVRYVERLLA